MLGFSTNSWGKIWHSSKEQLGYENTSSRNVDKFVWKNKEAVVLFSAGNDNGEGQANGKPAICGQAAAKNCITVGACGSGRDFPGTKDNTTMEQMWYRSSMGPMTNKRVKPDVVALGSNIISVCNLSFTMQITHEYSDMDAECNGSAESLKD
jgi:serine protease AprX